MKILFATYPMAFHTPGGGEVQLLKYREFLLKNGVLVDFFDPWNPNFKDYDIFHFFSCISGSNHLCNFVRNLGIPLVISSSLWLTDQNKELYPCEEIRSHLSLADKIITNSIIETKNLSDILNIPQNKFAHVYNGYDSLFERKISPDIFRSQFSINDKFILNVANIEPRKNQLLLCEAAKQLNIKLILLGHIRDVDYANQIFSQYSSNIIYLGYVPHSELLVSAYKACEVFCLPSTLETPGLAALEAGACGSKLVITSEGSTFEYFGNYAHYVNPESIGSIKSTLLDALLDSSPNNFAENSKYNWDNAAASLIDIYKSI